MTDKNREKDRLRKFLIPYLKEYLFVELADKQIKGEDTGIDFREGITVPLTKSEWAKEELNFIEILDNMAYVIGVDRKFPYIKVYAAILLANYKENVAEVYSAKAAELGEKEEYIAACIYYRAALFFKNDDINSLYGYARACRDIYLQGGEKELVGSFKAESIESFEKVTVAMPELPEPYYYLGYAYLNLGLYKKAELTWKSFCKLSEDEEVAEEIQERLEQLKEPVEIEQGCNAVISGKYREGIHILEKYGHGDYSEIWHIWYYIGVAYLELGEPETAIRNLKIGAALSPANVEIMKELMKAYRSLGDRENEKKYAKKISVVMESK